MTILVVERMENADRITLGIDKNVTIDKQALIYMQEHENELGIFELSYLQFCGLSVSPAQDTWYRNARTPTHVLHWREALNGAASHQNVISARLIFGNCDPEPEIIQLTDKTIDFDAAEFWLQKSIKGGSSSAAENAVTLQKKKLRSKFGANVPLAKSDFKFDAP